MKNRQSKSRSSVVAIVALSLLIGGCANDTQTGALLGAGVGALGGAIIGNNAGGHGATGALIGAGAGAAGGALIGNASDNKKRKQEDRRSDDRRYEDRSYDNRGSTSGGYYDRK